MEAHMEVHGHIGNYVESHNLMILDGLSLDLTKYESHGKDHSSEDQGDLANPRRIQDSLSHKQYHIELN